jgi:hypothetical protein
MRCPLTETPSAAALLADALPSAFWEVVFWVVFVVAFVVAAVLGGDD